MGPDADMLNTLLRFDISWPQSEQARSVHWNIINVNIFSTEILFEYIHKDFLKELKKQIYDVNLLTNGNFFSYKKIVKVDLNTNLTMK